MKRFPGRYKFVLKRDLTTGEQFVIPLQVIRKRQGSGPKPLEKEIFDDLRSFALNDNEAVVTLEVEDIETEAELLSMIKELKLLWNQRGNGALHYAKSRGL